jgi:hypothetical protein
LTRHLEAEAGWRGVAERSGAVAGVGRREVGDGTDMWGQLGGDKGRRRRRRATQTGRGDVFWPIRHCHAGRDGPSARAACGRKGKGPVAGWAEKPGGPAGRWADWAESEGKILFRIKIGFFNLPRL